MAGVAPDSRGLAQAATAVMPGETSLALSEAGIDASLRVTQDARSAEDGSPAPRDPALGPAGAAAPSRTQQTLDALEPAAAPTLLAVLLGLLAVGVEGLRALQPRLPSWLGRFGRSLAGATLAALALFSRIERGSAMDNPVRARVQAALVQEPGLSLTQVGQRAGIAWGTTVHHLRRLESLGLVVSVRERSERRYFVANTPAALARTAMAVVMQPTARRIAEFVADRPGVDQAGICQALGVNNPSASKHLQRFEAQGLVLSQRVGRHRLYTATGGLQTALQILDPRANPGLVHMTSRPASAPGLGLGPQGSRRPLEVARHAA